MTFNHLVPGSNPGELTTAFASIPSWTVSRKFDDFALVSDIWACNEWATEARCETWFPHMDVYS